MSTNDTFLAVFLGSKTSAKMAAWIALPEAERRAREQQGMAAWKAWVEKHQAAIVAMGGPLGKTKKVDSSGTADIANEMGAFTVVESSSARVRSTSACAAATSAAASATSLCRTSARLPSFSLDQSSIRRALSSTMRFSSSCEAETSRVA